LRDFVCRALAEAEVELDYGTAHPSLGLTGYELEAQVRGAGFVGYAGELRTFVDIFPNVDALLTWLSSSTFGNFLVDVPNNSRAAVRDALERLLQPKWTPEGIQLRRHLTFATARK
jgi:hypothetical protein